MGQIVHRELPSWTDPGLRRACHRACAGNPFYLRELIRALEKDELPPTGEAVEQVAATWLPPSPVTCCVASRPWVPTQPPWRVRWRCSATAALAHAGIAQLDDAGGLQLARVLREMDILAQEDPIRFAHPIVRLALQSGLAVDRHEELLRAASSCSPPRRPGSRWRGMCSPCDLAAVTRSSRCGAPRRSPPLAAPGPRRDLSAAGAGRAAPEADRVAILHELGMAEEMVVDEACLSHLVSARDGTLDPQARAARTIDLANAFAMLGRMPEAVTAIEDELADGHLVNDRARELLEAYVCALAWWNSDGNPRAQALLRRFQSRPPPPRGRAARAGGTCGTV